MSEHRGLPVAGYTTQPNWRVQKVNANKELEERTLRQMEHDAKAFQLDGRWLSIAKTHLEQAFMAWNRAIFQPQRLKLPEDEA